MTATTRVWLVRSWEPWASFKSPTLVRAILHCFTRTSAGSWIRNGAAETGTSILEVALLAMPQRQPHPWILCEWYQEGIHFIWMDALRLAFLSYQSRVLWLTSGGFVRKERDIHTNIWTDPWLCISPITWYSMPPWASASRKPPSEKIPRPCTSRTTSQNKSLHKIILPSEVFCCREGKVTNAMLCG